jgi:hypothetical protein
MNHPMMPPGKELSRRLLVRVPYGDRLPAGRLLPPVGIIPGHVRSLQELHLLLAPDVRSLPGINLNALAGWLEGIIGDGELAEAVRVATRTAGSYAEGCLRVYELLGQRLEQARVVAGQEVLT